MVDLYIDGRLVVLPDNFSITIIDENPFFTKKGTYTYDITLSLLDPINAKIYGHLNRKNKKDIIPENRRAYMVVDNEVVLNGTEVILQYSESQVKIQLVSGNSELNFLIGSDRKLRDLDLGEAVKHTSQEQLKEWLMQGYPEREYQVLPYYTWDHDILLNPSPSAYMAVGNMYAIVSHNNFDFYLYGAYGLITPQPYLCFIIDRIFESLGYSVTNNDIAGHPVFSKYYMVNGIQTRKYAEMLPDWTVKDFFLKIQGFFDCTFVSDPYKKTVGIYFNYKSQTEFQNTTDLEIYDEYTVDKDKDNNLDVRNSNTEYSLDSNDYHKYASIDPRYTGIAIKEPYATLDELAGKINASDNEKKMKIYTNDVYGDYIAYDTGSGIKPVKVNSFAPLYKKEGSTDIDSSLDIIPASMAYALVASQSSPESYWIQVPGTDDYDELDYSRLQTPAPPVEGEYFDLQELIEGDASLERKMPSKIRLAIYDGMKILDNPAGGKTGLFPVPYVESLAEYYPDSGIQRFFTNQDNNPFRLENMYKDIYSKSEAIDSTKTYKFTFVKNNRFNIMDKFIANNKAFRCARRERTVSSKGFEKYAKGDFYPYEGKMI